MAAPSAAKRSATALPIPRDAPVMSATLPSNIFPISSMFYQVNITIMLSIFHRCDKRFSQVRKNSFAGAENLSHRCEKSSFICAKIKIVLQPSKRTPTFAGPTTTLFIPSPLIGLISVTKERKKSRFHPYFLHLLGIKYALFVHFCYLCAWNQLYINNIRKRTKNLR